MVPPLPGPLLHSVEERGNTAGSLAGRESVQVRSNFGEEHLLNDEDAALDNNPFFCGWNYGLRSALLAKKIGLTRRHLKFSEVEEILGEPVAQHAPLYLRQ